MAFRHLGVICAAGLAALGGLGCATSASLGSISDSVSSPFEWSSSISGGMTGAYRDEIRDHVLAFVESGGSVAGFQRELSELARRHGLLNWEVEPASYRALGEGLRAAGVAGDRLELFWCRIGRFVARLQRADEGYVGRASGV